MEDHTREGMGRRAFLRASALGAAAATVPLVAETAHAAPLHTTVGTRLQPKYATAPVDMSKTYVNPINLPWMEVRRTPSTLPATDAGINSTQMLPILAKEQWVEADGRNLVGRARTGFRVLSENAFRTVADFSAVNWDGTIWLYLSGSMQNSNRWVFSTTDYINWQMHEMNIGPTAPTAVRVNGKYYLAGNNSPVYVADSPTGPWTQLGRFTRPGGQTISPGDVQFFLDEDTNRLYLSYNIGAPIMGVELDPNNPTRLLTEPVVVVDFDPHEEWMHLGDSKQMYNLGYVEGSQLFKIGQQYYIQVASGGTEHTTYSTGVYKSTGGPLGPFVPQANNPIGHDIGGNFPSSLYPDAGHGSFVQDADGNLVFFYTYVIAYEEIFERRMGIDICEVDDRGNISCRITNTPQLSPAATPPAGNTSRDAGLYNLATNSYAYWASSYAPGRTPYYATDRTFSTWWEPRDGDPSPTFVVGLSNAFHVSAIQINWKELGQTFTARNAVKYTVEFFDINANAWAPLVDKSQNTTALAVDYLPFDRVFTHAIRVRILGTTENVKVGILQLNVFGENYTLTASKGMMDLTHGLSLDPVYAILDTHVASGGVQSSFARDLRALLDAAGAAQADGDENEAIDILRRLRDVVAAARPAKISAAARGALLDALAPWLRS
ncbi:family 43 glycosylhydrolase [Motilibacter deserti]|uniref:Family 43 glycosylhydrolase n=1 Tax=Motilibacter deserti TaxID=2714956 RepID=A0ABX0GR86_9ACTN|nr:family 43 glycosylhydrolase [Motilibacter deserti]NHC12983.1 family 43 glycosylhydrolase [Motilibacter deserti]